jgi:hypothetical protein
VLVNEYDGRLHVFHLDAYRLSGDAELLSLGFEEMCSSGGVVLVELAGVKLITLRLSAQKECTVPLHGANGMANMLRGFNAVALRKVVGAASPPQDTLVFEFESLESGAAYAPVPRAPPAVRNVTLSRELLRPSTRSVCWKFFW